MKTSKTISILVVIASSIIISGCAALGSKTIVNSFDQNKILRNSKILLVQPEQENIDFYAQSIPNFYFAELEKLLYPYNIEVLKSEEQVDFDKVNGDIKLNLSETYSADYILYCKIIRLTAMGKTRDYEVEYKIVDFQSNTLMYHSKFSTTFGQTYVVVPGSGLPSEEQLIRDAIKKGFQKIEKDLLKN
jgi:hypothetical protein